MDWGKLVTSRFVTEVADGPTNNYQQESDRASYDGCDDAERELRWRCNDEGEV
jgi:hypothetical protein